MITALQALRRDKWELAGRVTDGETGKGVVQDSDPVNKREGVYRDEYQGRVVFRSKPYGGMQWNGETGQMEWVQSYPYSKRFGDDDPWSEESKQQWGENQDGTVGDQFGWILKGE
jgi:hypothetical protein